MTSNLGKRFFWADLIRILAIYLVLVTHLNSLPPKFSSSDVGVFVSAAIAAACVPLFIMLSGALLLGKKESYKSFFNKRLTKLVVPWLTWTIIYTAIEIYNNPTQEPMIILQSIRENLLSFWFLPLVTGLYLLTPATRIFVKAAKIKDILFVIFLWFIIISFLPYARNTLAFPLNVDNSLLRQVVSFYGYFLLGYLFIVIKLNKLWYYAILISLALGVLFAVFNIFIKYDHAYLSPGVAAITLGIFGIIYSLTNKINYNISTKLKYIITVMSQATLGVYFIHFLVMQVYRSYSGNYYLFRIYAPLDNYLNGIVLFLVSFLIIYSLQKIPFLKKII